MSVIIQGYVGYKDQSRVYVELRGPKGWIRYNLRVRCPEKNKALVDIWSTRDNREDELEPINDALVSFELPVDLE